MTDKAGRWLRVSTGGQDEASQVPDVDAWCDTRGYETSPDTTYTVHGKSAYHGEQDKMLDRVISDMRAGRINVLVVWAYDRIERRGAYNAFDLARRVKEAGGRIEYVKDSHLNVANEMSDVMLALAATVAHLESQRKSERIVAKHTALRRADSVIGRPPYGFRNICEVCQRPAKRPDCNGHRKIMVPVPSEAAVIQDAAAWYLNGMTLDEICGKLNANDRLPRRMKNGHQPLWCPKTLSGVLRNEAVVGRRRNGDGWTVKPDAILARGTWEAVIRRMDTRATRKGVSQTRTPALLTSIIKCGEHGRNMYRTGTGYYCRVRGCKAFVTLAYADNLVHESMLAATRRDIVETVIPGGGHDDEIADVKRDMQDAIQAEDFGRLASLKAELDRLRSMPASPGRVERRESEQTVSEMWAALTDDAARRQFLLDRGATITYAPQADAPKGRGLVFAGPWIQVA
jgi:DNA invertase Pin-like site-specific DNA recombinase